MKTLELSLPTPELNLACDEALLDQLDSGHPEEILRFWEPEQPFLVLGYAGRAHSEIHVPRAQSEQVPILRRCSGGGTVLQTPGCLNYSLLLRMDNHPELKTITGTNAFVLDRHCKALSHSLSLTIHHQGETDLALGTLKFSGNAQRRKRNALLFHGTFLLKLNVNLMEQLLRLPARQPTYRENRSHREFLTTLPCSTQQLKELLKIAWGATSPFQAIPHQQIQTLAQTVYGTNRWNFKF